ncbi:MAG: chemotaxis protein CheW [Spirochaetaceae bacterium]
MPEHGTNEFVSDETANQYLTFVLDNENYALNVGRVREVLELTEVTKIPRMPDYMKGVINVRSKVLPVVDLRLKFGMPEAEETVDTAIVVTDVAAGEDSVTIGCRADAVDQVIDIPPENIEPPPRVGTRISADFIRGIGKVEEKFIIILNLDRVFEADELEAVDSGARVAQA